MAYKEVNPFYKTKKWQRKRGVVMRTYDYLCQESRKYGIDVAAEVVHHIFPLEEYPELALVNWNLLPVTSKKHNTFHNRDDNTITAKGKNWQQKRMREFNEFYAELNAELNADKVGVKIMDTKVIIVWGCPGSGKTTYVKKHMQEGDMVVDLDFIKQSISMTGKTEAGNNFLNVALSIREHLYELIEYREVINSSTVWVVAGLPNKDDRDYLFNRLRADKMIQIKATKKECIERAMNDTEREDKELQLKIINKWFRQYTK